ncbi:translation initiation factor 2 (IF-2, GTPase) [Pseudomonas sp. GOM7]|uniref:translation initiation factor 2 (IF-2, GTPase) n=1 Tax=unclassified Pseudomonas TaxID=196821 RepID=UPI00227B55DA|nr:MULTISPECIES: translation initiation factor 2 (IF-2, GTPase) [unclassified Pseudomonas]WAJ35899.1 translation initiation factor 2 (IF-2, GTPase) [Pseudomonas sp. GOM7]
MRSISLPLLVGLLLMSATIQAEEVSPPEEPAAVSATAPGQEQIAELERRLAQSEQARGELEGKNAALLQRLRQENQRLRLQLKESQAQVQPRLLSEEQTWFAAGGALCLVSLLLGALLRGQRKPQRGWTN